MSILLLSIIFYVICDIKCSNKDTGDFISEIYNENGSKLNIKPNSGPLWLKLKSVQSNVVYWVKLKPKLGNNIPLLIKTSPSEPGHTQSHACLYSAASPLIRFSNNGGSSVLILDALSADNRFRSTEFLTVSLCDGVSGMVQLQNSTKFVHLSNSGPHRNMTRLELLPYPQDALRDPLAQSFSQIANRQLARHKRSKRSPTFEMPMRSSIGPFLVELYLVMDSRIEMANAYNNYYKLLNRITTIINYVNMAFSQFNIYFTVVQLEIWKTDQISLADEHHILLELQLYKRRFVTKHHDCLHAILGGKLGTIKRGQAEEGSMCGYSGCVGFTKDYADLSERQISFAVIHELGHNFGLQHDIEDCRCYGCIMSTGVQLESASMEWSICSKEQMTSLLHSGIANCLLDRPNANLAELRPFLVEPQDVLIPLESRSMANCRNGVVDEGEQCDCGSRESCPCCDAKTCRFVRGAQCAGGSCCNISTCSLKSSGVECRPQGKEDCDLPEFCNGKSEWCPNDMHKQDGIPCRTPFNEESYCYRGKCESRYSRCRMLYGPTSHHGPTECYDKNKEGKNVANCGIEIPRRENRYRQIKNWARKKCSEKDKVCGRLWCTHQNERVLRVELHESDEQVDYECSAVMFDMDQYMDEKGMVPSGSDCGSGNVCWKGSCVPISRIERASINCYCRGHGVCNNAGHCHCDPGFAPPNCTSPGNGGSIDSGPPGKFRSQLRTAIAGIIISLIVILTALVIAAFIYHYRHRTWPLILNTIKCPRYRIIHCSLRSCIKRDRKLTLEVPANGNECCVTLLSDLPPGDNPDDGKHGKCPNGDKGDSHPLVVDGSPGDVDLERAALVHSPRHSDKPLIRTDIVHHSPSKRPPILKIDTAKLDLDNNHRSPIRSPKSPKSPKSPVKSSASKPLTVREKAKHLEQRATHNTTGARPAITAAKPTSRVTSPGIQKPLANVPNVAVVKKPVKASTTSKSATENTRPPILGKKPNSAASKEPVERVTPKPVSPTKHSGPITVASKPSSNTKPPKLAAKPPQKSDKPTSNKPGPISKQSRDRSSSRQDKVNPPIICEKPAGSGLTAKAPPIICDKPTAAAPIPTIICSKPSTIGSPPPAYSTVMKSSKLDISQPRLEQTTCTDPVRELPSTDRTLARTIAPHRVLKVDPNNAGKYL